MGENQSVTYWAAQVGALTNGVDVLQRPAKNAVYIRMRHGDNHPHKREKLITALERAGVPVVSEPTDKFVEVDANTEPLKYDFVDVPYEA